MTAGRVQDLPKYLKLDAWENLWKYRDLPTPIAKMLVTDTLQKKTPLDGYLTLF